MNKTRVLPGGGEVHSLVFSLIRQTPFPGILFAFLILLFLPISYSHAQRFHLLKLNRMKHGLQQGLWVSYADSNHTVVEWKGRFEKGNEKGIWKYYYGNGKLRKKERYVLHRIKTSNYSERGKILSRGYAKIESAGDKLHYYYYGPWRYYSEDGKLDKIIYYEKGNAVKEEEVK